jgi:hypothetical protein
MLRSSAAPLGEIREFEGVYVAHWEVARFVIQTGRGFLGRPRFEKWQARFPTTFVFPDADAHDRHSRGRTYRMRVRGRLGPKGQFGHRGICTRQLEVLEVLDCLETSSPGRIW